MPRATTDQRASPKHLAQKPGRTSPSPKSGNPIQQRSSDKTRPRTCADHRRIAPALTAILAAILLLAAGCASRASSVAHLGRNQLSLNSPEKLDMRNFTFSYTVLPDTTGYIVRTTAWRKNTMPGWAEYVTTGWFAAYLSDQDGNLLAQDTESLYSGYMIPSWFEKGIELEFHLSRPPAAAGPVAVAFGYDLTLTDARFGGSVLGSTRSFDSDYDYYTVREAAR